MNVKKILTRFPFLDYLILAGALLGALYLTMGPQRAAERLLPGTETPSVVPVAPAEGSAEETQVSTPAATPLPVIVPLRGHKKMLSLDCEARSAVDYAAYYDIFLDELDFLYRLPASDNPDLGFVGNVYDDWGHIPPQSYGVHAEPVAALLRDMGVNAYACRNLTWQDVKRQIDAGQPVIVWVVGKTQDLGGGQTYTTPKGDTTTVAPYEHTVIVVGYQGDQVILVDGADVYTRPLDVFEASWSVLGNMAITNQKIEEE